MNEDIDSMLDRWHFRAYWTDTGPGSGWNKGPDGVWRDGQAMLRRGEESVEEEDENEGGGE